MNEPQKIKVLYFDEYSDTMSGFINRCSNKEIIDIVGAFHSIQKIAQCLIQDNFRLIKLLEPDVLVIKVTTLKEELCRELQSIRRNCRVKLVGIICGEHVDYSNVFDYYISASNRKSLITDEIVFDRLIYQIKSARLELNIEKCGIKGRWVVLPPPPKIKDNNCIQYKMIAIGASAGGTEAVTEVLLGLSNDMPPILIVQHIPENFSKFFANNLSQKLSRKVCVAHGGERLENGNIYIAGNDKHLEVVKGDNGEFYTKCTLSDKVSGHRPSVDVLFSSVAKAGGESAIGIILTGMGSDGAQGLLEMYESGAYTIGQDKKSSVVYGMPMVAYTLGAVKRQLPLNSISKEIMKAVARNESEDKDN